MAELIDETDALVANAHGLKNLSQSLATFNESFASFLYVLNMNALTTDWPQVSEHLRAL
jgi:DASH complex subunit DAM1